MALAGLAACVEEAAGVINGRATHEDSYGLFFIPYLHIHRT